MNEFILRFLISNLGIGLAFVLLVLIKHFLAGFLTSRMQYNLWYLFFGLLFVPFLPLNFIKSVDLTAWLSGLWSASALHESSTGLLHNVSQNIPETIYDFAISVAPNAQALPWQNIALVLLVVWCAGQLVSLLFSLFSFFRLGKMKKTAQPLHDKKFLDLYQECLQKIISQEKSGFLYKIHLSFRYLGNRFTHSTLYYPGIPIYTTDMISTPVIIGLVRPCIYLPSSLLDDYDKESLRHMLLHELQHYRHRDALGNCLAQLAKFIYWFNPFVRNAIRRMQNDRELSCDAAVLDMLSPEEYSSYGETLLTLAEKNALRTPAFGSGISQTMKKMQKRILQISTYRKPSPKQKKKALMVFLATAVLLLSTAPYVFASGPTSISSFFSASISSSGTGFSSASGSSSGHASDSMFSWNINQKYDWNPHSAQVTETDLSGIFPTKDGCFVLYDLQAVAWTVFNRSQSVKRVSPDSTFKIYDALFALEEKIITPQNSWLAWDQQTYPFAQWNQDQTLTSAMQASVNWYFHELNAQMGASVLQKYVQDISYGNQDLSADLSSFWLESSLKISAVEQVELLVRLYQNDFDFTLENMRAVRDALCISSSADGTLYGKTGTGRVDDKDVNGWFVGWIEAGENTYFFAVNLQDEQDATGSRAYTVALDVLETMGILSSNGIANAESGLYH